VLFLVQGKIGGNIDLLATNANDGGHYKKTCKNDHQKYCDKPHVLFYWNDKNNNSRNIDC